MTLPFTTSTADRADVAEPWFRRHPTLAVAVSSVLFVAVTVLRLAVDGNEDPITGLYALPVALLATAFGLGAGIVGGTLAVALTAVWAASSGVGLSPLGWSTRVTPLLLLGALVGAATDRARSARERARELAAVEALQREAAEVNDAVVQGLAVAKWLLESDQPDRALATVTETMATAQALVSHMLGPGSPLPGDLRRSRHGGIRVPATAADTV